MNRISAFLVLSLVSAISFFVLLDSPALAAPRVTNVCGTISSNTTWMLSNSPYDVCGTGLGVAFGVTLTIQPGVTVQFESNALLAVSGSLFALGTVTQPITFTGVIASPGSWQGIQVFGTTTQTNQSMFNYSIFDYGGVNSTSGAQLYLDRTNITITHSIIRDSGGHGVFGATQGNANISDTTFQNNAHYAIDFSDGSVNPTLGNLTAIGNGTNAIGLGGFASLQGTHVWENTSLPYIVQGSVGVNAGSELDIEPGVEVNFQSNQGLQVDGKLDAAGLPSQPITFTGTTKTPGFWHGITIGGTQQNPGVAEFDYATIEYGGGSAMANVYVNFGQASIRNSIIRNSLNDGVQIHNGTLGSSIFGSQIVGNTNYGVNNLVPTRPVIASNNWWGAATGPNPDSGCTTGSGSRVSTGVFFRPFLTSGTSAPLVSLTQAAILTLTLRRWFAPADNLTRVYFDITLVDGNGLPLSGRTVNVSSSLGNVVAGGVTDVNGKTLAYMTSNTTGDANVVATLAATSCEDAMSPVAKITFTTPPTGIDLLPNEQSPYADPDIDVLPVPVVRGISTTVQAKFTNPLTTTVTINAEIDIVQSSIGLAFGPLATFTGQVIPANSSIVLSTTWVPPVSGHYCFQVSYIITAEGARPVRIPAQGGRTKQKNINVYQAGIKDPSQQAQLDRTKNAVKATKAGVSATGVTKPFSLPLAIANGEIGMVIDYFAQAIGALQGDPPSQDYKHIVTPIKYSITPVQAGSDGPNTITPARAAAINAFADALATMNSYAIAAGAANDRYAGASQAKDLQWASLQTSALLDYRTLMAQWAITTSVKLNDLINEAASEGVTSVPISANDISAFQQQLATTGFTTQQINDAHAVGMTDADIESLRQEIIAADPYALAGDYIAEMQSVSSQLALMGNILLNPDVFMPTIVASGARPARPNATGNTLAQVFDQSSSFVLSNPLTQTAVITLVPRRIDVPADWQIAVSPSQVTLAPGATITVTTNIIPGSPVPQGNIPRIAVEAYAGSQLLGGVAIDLVVPRYVPGFFQLDLPLIEK